jgi:two-component system chemotaxis response regulator CheY
MRVRFVIADDAPFLRELIRNILSAEGGVCVGEAANGDEAVRIVQETLPDLIILDMVMPLRNGLETARAIKELHPEVKIIGCSTLDMPGMIQQAMDAGFDSYLVKPFTREQIIDAIKKLLPQQGESSHGRT